MQEQPQCLHMLATRPCCRSKASASARSGRSSHSPVCVQPLGSAEASMAVCDHHKDPPFLTPGELTAGLSLPDLKSKQSLIRGCCTGLFITTHWFKLPLDHADPSGHRITVMAREVVAFNRSTQSQPYLLYLQGMLTLQAWA